MTELVRDYASQNVNMVWNGIPLTATTDSFVTVSFEEDQILMTQAPDGKVATSLLPSTMGTIEVTLQQESPTHTALLAVLAAQKSSLEIQRGTFLLSITGADGAQLYTGINTAIHNPPDVAYGKTHEDGERTWTFKAAELKLLA